MNDPGLGSAFLSHSIKKRSTKKSCLIAINFFRSEFMNKQILFASTVSPKEELDIMAGDVDMPEGWPCIPEETFERKDYQKYYLVM